MDLATFANAPREVILAGHKYWVSALELREWAKVQAWIKANVPGPMRSLSSDDMVNLNDDDRRTAIEAAAIAQRSWPPKPGTAAWFHALDTPGGHEAFLHAALSKHQPEITLADVVDLSSGLHVSDVAPIVMVCLGLDDDDLKGSGVAVTVGKPPSNATTHSGQRPSKSRKPSAGRTKPSSR